MKRYLLRKIGIGGTSSGFVVEELSYANIFLFPVAFGNGLVVEKVFLPGDGSDVHSNPTWQDVLLSRLLFAEARWLVRHMLPFGLTMIAVGRKQ